MATTTSVYGAFMQSALNKQVTLPSDALKLMLATSAYVPNLDTDRYQSAVTNEITGTGYTAGGVTLTSVTFTYNATTNVWTLDADDATWNPSTITARYAALYDSTPGTAATNPLITLVDFGADLTSSNGPFTVQWNAAGIVQITVN